MQAERLVTGPYPNEQFSIKDESMLVSPQQRQVTSQARDTVTELRKSVNEANWGLFFAQGQTRTLASASWSASEERCEMLKKLCLSSGARRVLEIGSFCGVSTLAMAEVLPDNAHILSLEIDPFVVDFGLDIKVLSEAFWKIGHMVGPAEQSLESLMQRARREYTWEPFDMVIIDADKGGMNEYFEILSETPGMVSDTALFCVDVTPFKGQASTLYVKPGKEESYLINSGQAEIEAFRKSIAASTEFHVYEGAGLLQLRKKRKLANCTIGANPLASFPNEHAKTQVTANWAAPRQADPVEELRKAVINTDWASLFTEKATQSLAASSWLASAERCEKLQSICRESGAKHVLEIGSFCGVATLAMAQALPDNGHILSLELDPFLAAFGEDIKAKSGALRKITQMVGPAKDTLKTVAHCGKHRLAPFDVAVIDADKAGMADYFRLLWETPGMMSPNAVICVDIAPFKGQLFAPYVKGKLDDWIVKSGCECIGSFVTDVKSLPNVEITESNGMAIIRKRT